MQTLSCARETLSTSLAPHLKWNMEVSWVIELPHWSSIFIGFFRGFLHDTNHPAVGGRTWKPRWSRAQTVSFVFEIAQASTDLGQLSWIHQNNGEQKHHDDSLFYILFIYLFIYSFIHLFYYVLVYLFIYLFINLFIIIIIISSSSSSSHKVSLGFKPPGSHQVEEGPHINS